ncbi:MAG: DUF1405 domain-containing protein, partial [Candidatus Micrarchaeota archaeon]
SLIMLRKRIKAGLFYFIVIVGTMKYGFWTVYILSAYSPFYFTPQDSVMYTILFVSHIVLFLEPVVILRKIRVKAEWLLAAMLWFLLNDVGDYLLGLHPPIPLKHSGDIFLATVLMTFVFSMGLYLIIKKSVVSGKQ